MKSIHSAPLMRKIVTWEEGGLFRAHIAIITILDKSSLTEGHVIERTDDKI